MCVCVFVVIILISIYLCRIKGQIGECVPTIDVSGNKNSQQIECFTIISLENHNTLFYHNNFTINKIINK